MGCGGSVPKVVERKRLKIKLSFIQVDCINDVSTQVSEQRTEFFEVTEEIILESCLKLTKFLPNYRDSNLNFVISFSKSPVRSGTFSEMSSIVLFSHKNKIFCNSIAVFQIGEKQFSHWKDIRETYINEGKSSYSFFDLKEVPQGESVVVESVLMDEEVNLIDKILKSGRLVTSLTVTSHKLKNISNLYKILGVVAEMGSLRKLVFSNNNNLNDFEDGWRLIEKLIRRTKFLEELVISYAYMTDRHFLAAIEDFKNKSLRKIDISGNYLSFSSINELAPFLSKNENLEELYCQYNSANDFKADSVAQIALNLPNASKLRKVDFSGMIITGCGSAIQNLLKKCSFIEEFKISRARLNLHDFETILPVFEKNKRLVVLDISRNDADNEKAVELLIDFVGKTSVTHLNIENCGINEFFSLTLVKKLQENNSIIELWFKNEGFDLYGKLIDVCCQKAGFQKLFLDKSLQKDKEVGKKLVTVIDEGRIDVMFT